MNAPALCASRSRLVRQLSWSHFASSCSRYCNSASHSCRQSARKRRGTITPISVMSQSHGPFVVCLPIVASSGFLSGGFTGRERLKLREHPKPFASFAQCGAAGFSYFVILPRRPLLGLGDAWSFPFRADEASLLEPSESGVDGATGEAGDSHDVEAVAIAVIERLQNERHGVRQVTLSHSFDSCRSCRVV